VADRIKGLDWLRGLMAFSIMLYHYSSLSFVEQDAGTLLGRLSVYAVSIFFILSGLSIAVAYNKYIKNARTALFFLHPKDL
jgi:exopolysaccharide production protein ExoZ